MLDQIVQTKRREIEQYPKQFRYTEDPVRSLSNAVINSKRNIGLIAEVKKASPSKGIIRESFEPIGIAKSYEESGADAISVLTDRDYFQGDPRYLTEIRKITSIPLLRKDFIIDPIQVAESKAIGADAILLIQAILEPSQAKELYTYAKYLGLEVLMEVHSIQELETALNNFTPDLLGINNRDLKTFKTNVEHTREIAAHIPHHVPFISESGITDARDVKLVEKAGAKGILVGETLMRSHSITESIAALYGESK